MFLAYIFVQILRSHTLRKRRKHLVGVISGCLIHIANIILSVKYYNINVYVGNKIVKRIFTSISAFAEASADANIAKDRLKGKIALGV